MGCPLGFVVVGEPEHRYIPLCRILDAFEDVGCLFGVNIDHHLDIHRLYDDIRSRRRGSEYRRCPDQRNDTDRHPYAVHARLTTLKGSRSAPPATATPVIRSGGKSRSNTAVATATQRPLNSTVTSLAVSNDSSSVTSTVGDTPVAKYAAAAGRLRRRWFRNGLRPPLQQSPSIPSV
ncbi:hypothetical protein [Mycobacterium sp.]|jgi:hypothetical protein|uniref:hypothetical protein n=1 Tax=Mycobacterium sp. TaxID=1785 RepID=UPI003342DB54